MTYHALARTWRPRTFSQLVGQESVVRILSNSLDKNRLHHAFLFTGTRGVGKTSVARLFAKAMNCERGLSSEPCLQCSACIAIEQGCFIDLMEIDAASHTGVEHMRELLDNVQYAPASARFKVYLIDEIHMLSTQSFNALLKTLEEPPSHVKFLLATTDPQKLPKTVLSRCLQFHLQHISANTISQHLTYILEKEAISFEVEAVNILAKAAGGSMRDALSLLDQAIAGASEKILTRDVKQILGYAQQDYALQLLQALGRPDAEMLHQLVQEIADEGSHFLHILEETLHYLHEIAVYQTLSTDTGSISDAIRELAKQFSPEDIQLFYQIALKGTGEIHLAPGLKIGFHMIFLRMLVFKPALPIMRSDLPINQQTAVKNTPVVVAPEEPVPPLPSTPALSDKEIQQILPDEPPTLIAPPDAPAPANLESKNLDKTQNWSEIIHKLSLQGLALTALQQTELLEKKERECILIVTQGHHALFTPTVRNKVQQALSDWYGEKIVLTLKIEEIVLAAPARQQEKITRENQAEAEHQLMLDPVFQQIQQDFSAKLIENSTEYAKNDT